MLDRELEHLRLEVEKNHDPFKFYLYITISGECLLNNNHPYRKDEQFLKLLLEYYERPEDFERCIEVRNSLSGLS